MNFQAWFNEADMPEMVNGQWVDLETGIPFLTWTPAKRESKKHVLMVNGKPAKVSEGLAYVARLSENQAKAVDRAKERHHGSANLEAYITAAEAAISAAKSLCSSSKKHEIASAIALNQAASRASNKL